MAIDLENFKFLECTSCASKYGTPTSCPSCRNNRAVIEALRKIARVHSNICMRSLSDDLQDIHHISFEDGSRIILSQGFLKKIDEEVKEEVRGYLKRWFGLVMEDR